MSFCEPSQLVSGWLNAIQRFFSGEELSEGIAVEVPVHVLLQGPQWRGDCLPDLPLLGTLTEMD